ncbi:MAG: hypothetical protein FJ291_16590 [Planctomycetes bacterium]|nr:hypothetical protein [Planctomycetota bacterium]
MSEGPPSRRFPLWETLAILGALASLWPAYVLNLKGTVWRGLCFAMLVVMVVVLVRRLLAFERMKEEARRKEAKGGEQGRARLPWEPRD